MLGKFSTNLPHPIVNGRSNKEGPTKVCSRHWGKQRDWIRNSEAVDLKWNHCGVNCRDERRGLEALEKLKDTALNLKWFFINSMWLMQLVLLLLQTSSKPNLGNWISSYDQTPLLQGISGYTVDDIDALKTSISSGGGEAARSERSLLERKKQEALSGGVGGAHCVADCIFIWFGTYSLWKRT